MSATEKAADLPVEPLDEESAPADSTIKVQWNTSFNFLEPATAASGNGFFTYTDLDAGAQTNFVNFAAVAAETDEEEASDESGMPTWEGELAFEGLPSSDGRVLLAGEIINRDLPLTLKFQSVTAEGHDGAEACGKITHIWREPREDLGHGVVAIMGSGEFSSDPELCGATAAAALAEEIVRHVSVDIAPTKRVMLNAKTMEEITDEEFDIEAAMNGEYLVGIGGEIMGATMVAFSAFADAQLRIAQVASAQLRIVGDSHCVAASAAGTFRVIPKVLTASAAKLAPIRPKKDWFFQPEPEGKFPLTVMDDGRVMGHLATWDQCHHGFRNECVLAKPSKTRYAFFHVGQIKTEEGEMVDIGRLMVGEKGHAPIGHGRVEASRFYDKTGCVGAFVRAVDGKYGIWLSGVVRSDCPAEKVRDMVANPPSGDWRSEGGSLELVAALSVPVPGFPVPRYEYSLRASADDDVEVVSLVATGYVELNPPTYTREAARRKQVLVAKALEALADEDA